MFSMTIAKKNTLSKLFVGLSLSLLMCGKAEATTFKFEKVVDTNTVIPNSNENFAKLSYASLNQSVVTFQGIGSNQTEGIYTSESINGNRSLKVVADTNTSVPEGTGNFIGFDGSLLSKREIVFQGLESPGNYGIYIKKDGILSAVANNNTAIPEGSENFKYLSYPIFKYGKVVFSGIGSGSFPQKGIYTYIGGLLSLVVDTNTLVPGHTENFSLFFNNISINNRGDVAFLGQSLPTSNTYFEGVYNKVGSSLNPVADTNTSVPSDPRNLKFCTFGNVSLNNQGNVAFEGDICPSTNNPNLVEESGIYTNIGGTLKKVIATNDVLDGKMVRSFIFLPDSLFGNKIVFLIFFTDRSEGIYSKVGSSLNLVADTNISVPSHPGNVKFCNFANESLNQGNIAFEGSICNSQGNIVEETGIYTNIGGKLTKVIAKDDVLDGKIVGSSSSLINGDLFGNKIVFSTTFTDNSQAIYVATATSDDEFVDE